MHREYQARALLNLPLMCGEFEVELEILYGRMALEVINVLEPFLTFVVTFNVAGTHNMCVFQLDPRFKALQGIMEYVGKWRNPSLGFTTKTKACKVASQEGSPIVTSRTPGSAKECEGMNPHTPK
jgi:hypothetical protein